MGYYYKLKYKGGDIMYILTLEEEDFPYPIKITIEFDKYEDAIKYVAKTKGEYKFVGLVRKAI